MTATSLLVLIISSSHLKIKQLGYSLNWLHCHPGIVFYFVDS